MAASQRPLTSKDLLASLRTLVQKFRPTRWFRIVYLVLLGVLVAQLYLLTATAIACLVIILMPVSVFVVPYWLGERRMRAFAGNAVLVFGIAILIAAAMSTQALLAQNEAVPIQSLDFQKSGNMTLANGTVTPYRGPPPVPFTFRLKLITLWDGDPANFSVFLNLTVVTGLAGFDRPLRPMAYDPGNGSSNNTKDGAWYVTRLSLTDSIYGYGLSVWDQDRNWTLAGPDFGPLIASGWTFYGFFVYFTALSGVMLLAFVFYFGVLLMWWYARRARQARGRVPTAAKDIPKDRPKPGPSPKPGQKAVKAAALTCTNCGADVSAADDKCPKCGAVFED